jgi:hypothetical protein
MEYIDSKTKINVYNLPLYKVTKPDGSIEKPLILKDIRTIKGVQNIELKEGIKLIELSLSEIIDFLIKKSLHDEDIERRGIDYYIVGGKAINNIIKLKYLEKSFDFDIHVKNRSDIINISEYITQYCNEELNKSFNKHYRRQIYKKLLSLQLVYFSDRECEHYYKHNDLIFFGDRFSRINNNKISGLFIKLKLSNNLFIHNKQTIRYTNKYRISGDLVNVVDLKNNILYIPIADIDSDNTVAFGGVTVYKPNRSSPSIYKNPLENINYADFSILLFNLLKCVARVPNKIESNGNKLKKLIKLLYYNCNIYNEYNSLEKINTMYRKIIKQLIRHKDTIIYQDGGDILKKFIDDNKVSGLSRNTTYGTFIENIVNKFINLNDIPIFKEINCRPLLGVNSVYYSYNLFIDGIDSKLEIINLQNIIADLDKVGNYYYFLQYTGALSKPLNTYCLYLCNDINEDVERYRKIGVDISIDVYIDDDDDLTKRTIAFKVPDTFTYNHAMLTMNDIYDKYHKHPGINRIKNVLAEDFYVYSLQHITNFTMMDGLLNRSFIDLSHIKEGDVIQISQYLSTSFNSRYNILPYLSDTPANRVFLKIKINKNNKNWIFLNKYSKYTKEYEILLKQNSIFIVKSINYEIVSINQNSVEIKKEFKIITLEISNDINLFENNLLIKKVLTTLPIEFSYNILKSSLFIKVLKYVYNTYFRKPYTESNCMYFSEDQILNCEYQDDIGNSINDIIYKYNHALAHTVRVASWIQLLYCQDKNYNSEFFRPINRLVTNLQFRMKICIASLFMITGRESEAGFSTRYNDEDLTRNCPGIQPNPYYRYKTASANNFKLYVNLQEIKDLELFTEEDIEDYTYCLKYYSYIYHNSDIPNEIGNNITITNDTDLREHKRKKIATYFHIAHENDLIRCRGEKRVGTLVPPDHESYTNQEKLSAQLMYDIVKNTGDRILSTRIIYDIDSTIITETQNYDIKLFYFCSTNPEYCITAVLNTTDEYFNQLIYKSMESYIIEGKISKDKLDNKNFVLQKLYDNSQLHSDVPSPIINPPILRGGSHDAFISDDNNIDIDSINVEVNNSNLGSTFYMSRKSYREIIKNNYEKDSSKDDFTNNGIYFQNICISFDKSWGDERRGEDEYKDKNYEKNIYEKIVDIIQIDEKEIINYERYVYPQYFIKSVTDKRTAQQIENDLKVKADDTVEEISSYQKNLSSQEFFNSTFVKNESDKSEHQKIKKGLQLDKENKNLITPPQFPFINSTFVKNESDKSEHQKIKKGLQLDKENKNLITPPQFPFINKQPQFPFTQPQFPFKNKQPQSRSLFKNKYLKYKKKYIELKNKLNL